MLINDVEKANVKKVFPNLEIIHVRKTNPISKDSTSL